VNDVRHPTFDARLTTTTLEHELQLVNEAVTAVASGRFPRITVVGLRFGDEVLPAAYRLAEDQGLRVLPVSSADEHGSGLVVERPPEGAT
jgi:hypothetical protein